MVDGWFCDRCGSALAQGAWYCQGCGRPLNAAAAERQTWAPYPTYQVASPSNAWSNWGIACGIISWLCVPYIFGPIGLILSAVAWRRAEEKAGYAFWVNVIGIIGGILVLVLLISTTSSSTP